MHHFLAEQTVHGIAIGLAGIALIVEDHRDALVGRLEYGLRLGNYAKQADGKDFLDVLDAEHFTFGDAFGVVSGQQQVF